VWSLTLSRVLRGMHVSRVCPSITSSLATPLFGGGLCCDQMGSDLVGFAVGDRFDTFSEVDEKIRRYEKERFVQFYKRDSRKIESARKRAPHKNFKEEIVYSKLVFSCIHGGKKFKSKSVGKRPNQR